eukprot:3560726-Amphidinium_carterae.1
MPLTSSEQHCSEKQVPIMAIVLLEPPRRQSWLAGGRTAQQEDHSIIATMSSNPVQCSIVDLALSMRFLN